MSSRLPLTGNRRQFLAGAGATAIGVTGVSSLVQAAPDTWLPVSAAKLPRWRGFNLLAKFTLGNNQKYNEWDFKFIAKYGFNFVRFPLDYRIWTTDSGEFLEDPLKEIDDGIAYARTRGIHVALCLHRAPGYCVNPPKEARDLWGDGPESDMARQLFADQWRMFAKRYKDIPSTELSFNLVNEPPTVTGAQYLRVATAAVTAIREEDPTRLVIADGTSGGRDPTPELAVLRIAQGARGYQPFKLTHYRASWFAGSDEWPVPTWPLKGALNGYLYGNAKPDLQSTLRLLVSAVVPSTFSITVGTVSGNATLLVRADGQPVFEKHFDTGPGVGEWAESHQDPQYHNYLARYDKDYTVKLPAGVHEISVEVTQGDWLTFNEISLDPYHGAPNSRLTLVPGSPDWGVKQDTIRVEADGSWSLSNDVGRVDQAVLWKTEIEPWKKLEALGVGVIVGEWGVYKYTPHDVTLAWMKDSLENWQKAGWGWCLWNLRGDFGPLNSNRTDVKYEDFYGTQLDRAMLDLLMKY